MTQSKVEEVALALFAADGLKHADGSTLEQSWADSPRYHEEYRRKARAAISAMREPSEKMVKAIEDSCPGLEYGEHPVAVGGYKAGIDAALEE